MKYDASRRPEIVHSPWRARILKVLLWLVVAQAALVGLWCLFLLVKFRNNDAQSILELRAFLTAFALPATGLLLLTSGLGVYFAQRRNATFRMLATFVGGLMVMLAVLFRGSPLGIVVTLYGVLVVGLAWWPDKAARVEAAGPEAPEARA